jgi:fermentation-respiration switch protein FrsA (DUF1100 family)
LLGAAAYATQRLNGRMPRRFVDDYTFTPFELGVAYEEVGFASRDGLRLSGWWLPRPESERVVICCAGHRGVKSDMLGIGSGLWRSGNNVLVFDWRSRGGSEGRFFTLAHAEQRDAEGALDFALKRMPRARVGLIGYSMGAAVAIMVASRRPEVRAVVADSPFTSIAALVRYASGRKRLPGWAVTPLADMMTAARFGYRFGDVRPIEVVAQISPRPLLLIHGTQDSVIPSSHSRRLYATAGEPKQLWEIEGLEHCGAYFADRAGYIARVAAFFDEQL